MRAGATSAHLAMVFIFARMTGKGYFCDVSQQVSSDDVGQLKEHWTPEEDGRGRGLSFLTKRGRRRGRLPFTHFLTPSCGDKDIYNPPLNPTEDLYYPTGLSQKKNHPLSYLTFPHYTNTNLTTLQVIIISKKERSSVYRFTSLLLKTTLMVSWIVTFWGRTR